MIRRRLPLALALLAALAASAAGQEPAAGPRDEVGGGDVKELVRRARPSVFRLEIYDALGAAIGSGTGFLVAPGQVASNHHVVEGAARIELIEADGKKHAALGILRSSERDDLALIQVAALAAPPLAVRGLAGVEPGDRVVVLGAPLGMALAVSDGLVAALWARGPDRDWFPETPLMQVTAPISPGSSGSPVLNARGEVIGVAVGTYVRGQNVNWAISGDRLLELMAASSAGALEVDFGKPGIAVPRSALLRNLAISALFFGAIALAAWRLGHRSPGKGQGPARRPY